jgi:hypothetical protein
MTNDWFDERMPDENVACGNLLGRAYAQMIRMCIETHRAKVREPVDFDGLVKEAVALIGMCIARGKLGGPKWDGERAKLRQEWARLVDLRLKGDEAVRFCGAVEGHAFFKRGFAHEHDAGLWLRGAFGYDWPKVRLMHVIR